MPPPSHPAGLDAPLRHLLANMAELPGTPCPCGVAQRAFVDDPLRTATFHITRIHADARTHYHREHTEIYYCLEGQGRLELDGQSIPVQPGLAAMIKPGCRHRAIGQLTFVIVSIPAFDPADEHFD